MKDLVQPHDQLRYFGVRIQMRLGLPDPDPLVSGIDPYPAPGPYNEINQK
jgi:hypothetical protein